VRRCPDCAVAIEGDWDGCPLCGAATTGEPVPDPYPVVPLRFSRRRVLRALFLSSLAVIAASFVAQLLFARDQDGIGALRSMWLGVSAMWLVVLMAVRQRRNLAKGTLYLVVLISGVCLYWDYLTSWHGWSLTYAVPIVCACSIVALLITVRVMRLSVGDHSLSSGLTVVLGLAPVLFLALGWVANPVPSGICGIVSVLALALLQVARGRPVRHELAKRLHL